MPGDLRRDFNLATVQAAVLAHGIAEPQSFVDGNKREALIALVTFLELNGYVPVSPTILSLPSGSSASAPARRPRTSPDRCARLKPVT